MSNLAVEILRNAKARPDHPAMRTVGTTLTYAELEEEAWKAAQVLRGQGISAGDVIGLALRDSRQTYIAMLGAWLLGATCNLLDFRSSAEQRRGFAEMFAQKLLIEDGPVEGERLPISLTGWEALLDGAPAEAVAPVPSSAPAVIPVTSGTTGKPAGFPVSHEACLWRARSWRGTRAIETYKRFLSTGPMSFGANLGWVTNVLLSGGTVTFFPPMNRPRDICEVFRAHRIVSAVMVPTALRDLLAYVRETGDRIGEGEGEAMPWLVTTGAAISASELEALEEMLTPNIIQVYASSPVGATTVLFSDNFEGRRATVGRPLAGVELEIVDADDAPRAPGEIGHLRVRTPGRATAILGREAGKGGDRFKGDWYYPGDLGSLDADGYLT
ncbi:MAG: AMP-binding protein, partial [Pseudomonadota bacterium]